jgi:micrococcal nuclease
MKKSWIPAALMGCLGLGYLAGSAGGGPRDKGSPREYEPPAASVPTATPLPPVEPPASEPAPAPTREPTLDDGLAEYPPWNGIDLDCGDIRRPVRVPGPDPHRLDHDGNGVGCESYGS